MAEEINNFKREGLPISGTEREIIKYYFHRGFQCKHIVFFLEKYHDIRLPKRTLKRKLKDFVLKRREAVDENVKNKKHRNGRDICWTGQSKRIPINVAYFKTTPPH